MSEKLSHYKTIFNKIISFCCLIKRSSHEYLFIVRCPRHKCAMTGNNEKGGIRLRKARKKNVWYSRYLRLVDLMCWVDHQHR